MSAPGPADDLPPPPAARLIERKIGLDGSAREFPLERWLVGPRLIVGRWSAIDDPQYENLAGFTSWGVWWPGLPYGAYRVHAPDGSLRVHRLDALNRVECDGEAVSFEDLLLDMVIKPDGEAAIEDEDEVEQALAEGRLDIEQRWRIAWVRDMFERRPDLLVRRIDAAIAEAVESVRSGRP